MMTACTRVAARLWLPLLKARGLLLLVVLLLHACWHGAFKADICRNTTRHASPMHAQAVPGMQQRRVELVVRDMNSVDLGHQCTLLALLASKLHNHAMTAAFAVYDHLQATQGPCTTLLLDFQAVLLSTYCPT